MKHPALALVVAGVLAACATGPQLSEADRLALYRAHAGEPVDSFRYLTSPMGWTPLGDEALVVRMRPREGYLLEFGVSCPNLDFAHAITITNQLGRVHSRFDDVVPLGSGSMTIPCRIREIRPVDLRAVDEAEDRMLKQVQMVERAQSDGGT